MLATILLSAGVGSLVAGNLQMDPIRLVRRVAVPAVLVLSVGLYLALDAWGHAAAVLPLGGRLLVGALVLAPIGFFLGMPFPTGLRALSTHGPALVPWAIAANGFNSVIGTALALPLAMIFGYGVVLAGACVLYVVAALSFPATAGSPPPGRTRG